MMAATSLLVGALLCICFSRLVRGDELTLGSNEPPFCSRSCEVELVAATSDSNVSFPLYQCSCSRSCSVYGDCCYDSPFKNARLRERAEFICLSVLGYGHYRAVFSCPSGRLSDFCKDGLGILPPVTSKVTNVTYANRFCAICNEDGENLLTWNVELRCSADANVAAGDNGSTRYIYRSGNIWSLSGEDGTKTSCEYHALFNGTSFMEGMALRTCSNIKKIATCASSWRNRTVLKKCESYEDPVFFGDRAYQNAHCAECNYRNPRSMECVPLQVKLLVNSGSEAPVLLEFCRSRGLEECLRSLAIISKGGTRMLADMFYTNDKVTCVPPRGRRCCKGYSYKYGACRPIF